MGAVTTPPQYIARPVEIELNGPCTVIYYDDELHEEDGNGWCIEFSEGSVTYRYPTLADACQWLLNDGYGERFMRVRLV